VNAEARLIALNRITDFMIELLYEMYKGEIGVVVGSMGWGGGLFRY